MLAAVLLAACAPAAPAAQQRSAASGTAASGEQRSAPKRLVAATAGEPSIPPAISIPGDDELRVLVNAGLTVVDNTGSRRPQLAEAVPSIDNGLWKLFPDGRMETRWKIRDGATWHDGIPVTSADFIFTAQVAQDRELAAFGHDVHSSIDSVEAPDPRTVVVSWKRPYVDADGLFSHDLTPPLPSHLLEKPYLEDKSTFTQLPFWTDEYVGSGPYQMREWVRGSYLVLGANDRYVLGRPKIDEIEIRFMTDANTLMASILSGAIQTTLGRSLSIEQAAQLREQWRDGSTNIEFGITAWLVLIPQFVNPNPPAVANTAFRLALLHAIDRQEMADTLNGGLVPVAHSWLSPGQPQYRAIEESLPKYEFDPRAATQAISTLGFTRGPDGMFVDSADGQRLELEIRNIGLEISRKSMFAVADYWQKAGVGVSTVVIPPQRVSDFEYRATFPAFQLFNQPNDVRGMPNLYSSRARLPSNNFQVPGAGNHTRYMSPELDGLLDQYYSTIPRPQRTEALGRIVRHIAENLNLMGLFYNGDAEAISNRVTGVTTARAGGSLSSWNAHEWDMK